MNIEHHDDVDDDDVIRKEKRYKTRKAKARMVEMTLAAIFETLLLSQPKILNNKKNSSIVLTSIFELGLCWFHLEALLGLCVWNLPNFETQTKRRTNDKSRRKAHEQGQ